MKIKNFGSTFFQGLSITKKQQRPNQFLRYNKKEANQRGQKISEKRKTLIQSQFFSHHDFRRNEMINERKGF